MFVFVDRRRPAGVPPPPEVSSARSAPVARTSSPRQSTCATTTSSPISKPFLHADVCLTGRQMRRFTSLRFGFAMRCRSMSREGSCWNGSISHERVKPRSTGRNSMPRSQSALTMSSIPVVARACYAITRSSLRTRCVTSMDCVTSFTRGASCRITCTY